MHIEEHGTRSIGSSPFISTYEPINLPKDSKRILLESHSTHSNKTTETDGQLRESAREQFSVSTVVLLSPMLELGLTRVSAVLVALKYESDSGEDEVFDDGESVEMRVGGISHMVRKAGPYQDQFGLWEWDVRLPLVPLKLVGRTVRGKLRMSGRGCQLPRELREVELDRYWEGRSNFLDELGD